MDEISYPPSEDTYLLIDGCRSWFQEHGIRAAHPRTRPVLVLEVGCAAAFVLEALATDVAWLDGPQASSHVENCGLLLLLPFFIGSDVNLAALHQAQRRLAATLPIDLVCGSLMTALRADVFDLVLFNSPYVETSADELAEAQRCRDLRAAWAGGWLGLQVAAALIRQFMVTPTAALTSEHHASAWLLLVTQDRTWWHRAFSNQFAFFVKQRRAGDERLLVLALSRSQASLWYKWIWQELRAVDDSDRMSALVDME
jgi:methylase of polypeptide subunit release factors